MEIQLKESQTKGAAIALINDQEAGKMTYSIASENKIIIDHTEVEDEFNGQGVGKSLLIKIVEMAREKQIKILPLCPFAKAMFEKNEELRDVLS